MCARSITADGRVALGCACSITPRTTTPCPSGPLRESFRGGGHYRLGVTRRRCRRSPLVSDQAARNSPLLCASCNTRRLAETAAQRVDRSFQDGPETRTLHETTPSGRRRLHRDEPGHKLRLCPRTDRDERPRGDPRRPRSGDRCARRLHRSPPGTSTMAATGR